ncbi:MAG TPA: CocE/NonD family hydrolase C-terminal non-catalytic domain-containing protein [Longimicrobium sp.]|nr:CocE/NonD family hydrolase C-terminal non-catalytic domain-containing protein [Longimicrobium sp.]
MRGEPFPGKFRESFERPVPFVPGRPARVAYTMPDVHHAFRRGHRIMVQVQSSWFPLVDRNPQTFVDIYHARESDFRSATHRVHRSAALPSSITVGVLERRASPGAVATRRIPDDNGGSHAEQQSQQRNFELFSADSIPLRETFFFLSMRRGALTSDRAGVS